jgi:hypothetical protein
MKIKLNWGTGLLITIISGITFFVSFILFSLTHDINLVSKDYFPEEIAYEEKIDKINNADKLIEKITLKKKENQIVINYPKNKLSKISGKILLYYVTSYRHDKEFTLKPNKDGKQYISTGNLKKGRYYVKIDWEAKNTKYFQEFKITL